MYLQGNFLCRESAGTTCIITQSVHGAGRSLALKFKQVGES
jgi:hypothetical protein